MYVVMFLIRFKTILSSPLALSEVAPRIQPARIAAPRLKGSSKRVALGTHAIVKALQGADRVVDSPRVVGLERGQHVLLVHRLLHAHGALQNNSGVVREAALFLLARLAGLTVGRHRALAKSLVRLTSCHALVLRFL